MSIITATVTQFAGGVSAYRNPTAPRVADYLYWMAGVFVSGVVQQPGGSVAPPSLSATYPFIITAVNFEPDGVSYNNPNIVGDRLMIYVNHYNQTWFSDTDNAFVYTATGIRITLPGFNIFQGFPPFSVVIQLNNA